MPVRTNKTSRLEMDIPEGLAPFEPVSEGRTSGMWIWTWGLIAYATENYGGVSGGGRSQSVSVAFETKRNGS